MRAATAIGALAVCAAAQAAAGEERVAIAPPFPSMLCNGPARDAADDFRSGHCADLKVFHEPAAPVEGIGKTVESYRLLYLRSFDPPIALRLEIQSDTGASLSAKELRTHSERMLLARTAYLTPEQIANFRALIAQQNFWTAPSEFHVRMGFGPFATPLSESGLVMSDGAQWIVEGIDARRYHVMGDDGGAFESPVREIGLALLDLAEKKFPGLDVKPIY